MDNKREMFLWLHFVADNLALALVSWLFSAQLLAFLIKFQNFCKIYTRLISADKDLN